MNKNQWDKASFYKFIYDSWNNIALKRRPEFSIIQRIWQRMSISQVYLSFLYEFLCISKSRWYLVYALKILSIDSLKKRCTESMKRTIWIEKDWKDQRGRKVNNHWLGSYDLVEDTLSFWPTLNWCRVKLHKCIYRYYFV